MVAAGSATPLIALDAVVIDTETTGLDAGKARLRRDRGRAHRRRTHRAGQRLAPPGAAGRADPARRPPPSTASTPPSWPTRRPLPRVWPELAAQHRRPRRHRPHGRVRSSPFSSASASWPASPGSIRACSTRGCWRRSPSRDLAGYSLDQLASWLGVEVAGRHSALGDAMTTAAVFQALVPKLRERGIRTLAEAMHGLPRAHRRCSTSSIAPAGWRPSSPRAATPSARSAASTAIPTGIASAT